MIGALLFSLFGTVFCIACVGFLIYEPNPDPPGYLIFKVSLIVLIIAGAIVCALCFLAILFTMLGVVNLVTGAPV